jgi:hypothetical protein
MITPSSLRDTGKCNWLYFWQLAIKTFHSCLVALTPYVNYLVLYLLLAALDLYLSCVTSYYLYLYPAAPL